MHHIKKTAIGLSWIGLLRGSTRGIAFIKIAVIARLLTPEQFGWYGIAALVLSLLEIFTETGINIFFVQKEAKLEKYINTAWIISIARGFLMFILILLFSPLIATFFNAREATNMLMLISFVPLIKGFINPAESLFQSKMRFKDEFLFRFVIFAFDAIVATIVAIYTNDPTSIIWGLIVGAVLEVILSFAFLKPRPRFNFEYTHAKHIVSRGKWLTGFGVLEYIFRNGDDVVVGKLLGASNLGVYQVAYKLAMLPISEVADVVGKVTLPVFVKVSTDNKKLKTLLIYTTIGVFITLFPVVFLLSKFPESIIRIVLGDQWIMGAGVLQILVFYAFTRAIINPALTIFLAIRKQEYVTVISAIGTFTLCISIFPLMSAYGLNGVALSTVIASLMSVVPVLYYLHKTFKSP